MNKSYFTDQFISMREKQLGYDPDISTDIDDAFETYNDLMDQLDNEGDDALVQMVMMQGMTKPERLKWRMCLAEEGIEMTPRQVDEYLIILGMALKT